MPGWIIAAIVGGQLIALALFYFAPRFWIKLDVAEFKANGSQDSRHETFHRQRLSWRGSFDVLVALVCSLPWCWLSAAAYWSSCIGLASLGGAYFFFKFNPGLSLARGLAYVQQYYVSFDPAASWWPDRLLAQRAIKAWPDYGTVDVILDKQRRAHAARELQVLTWLVLGSGMVTYLACGAYVAHLLL